MADTKASTSPSSRKSSWLALVADDSANTRTSLATAIRGYDEAIEVVETGNGRHALDVLTARKPDLAFINLQLQEISGAEALAWARRHGVKPLTILMSNQVLPKWVEVSNELGAYEFWRKRFDPAHLIQLLDACRLIRTPMKLLLVDESPTAREIVSRLLSNCRFSLEVHESDSGPHALTMMRQTHYDVALIDSTFSSGISGFETACQARVSSPETKLVLMTGGPTAASVAQAAAQFGLQSFLKKPFYARDVEFALHTEFGLRRPYLLNALVAPAAPEPAASARA
jgi:CheY-like chemotaxis protein